MTVIEEYLNNKKVTKLETKQTSYQKKVAFLSTLACAILLLQLSSSYAYTADPLVLPFTASSSSDTATGDGNSASVLALPKNIIAAVFQSVNQFSGQSQVDVYKKYLDSNDLSTTFTPCCTAKYQAMLPGGKAFEVGSLSALRDKAATYKDSVYNIIGFDIESDSRSDPVPNAVSTIQQGYNIAHQFGYKFMPVPGVGANSPQQLAGYAPYSDLIILQGEGHMDKGATAFKNFVDTSVKAIRSANSNVPIILELSVANEAGYNHVSYVEQLYSSVANEVNGIHIWFDDNKPGELSQVNQILNWFVQHYG